MGSRFTGDVPDVDCEGTACCDELNLNLNTGGNRQAGNRG